MDNDNGKTLHILTFIIIVLSCITSLTGLLYNTAGKAYNFVNQYGDTVKIYGRGLYAHDSNLMANTAKGTDLTIICFAVPLLIAALIIDVKKKNLKSRLFLTSVISVFAYYSASISFGLTYNILQLIYIALFSAGIFGLIIAIKSMDEIKISGSMKNNLPLKGIYIFLALVGAALIVAWLPDIVTSLISGRSLETIEVYTTQITYVLDMGIVAPAIFICMFQLKRRSGMGYVLLGIILTLCCIIGVMLPIQTAFQLSAGIPFTLQVTATKIASFVILAVFALYFDIRLFNNMKN